MALQLFHTPQYWDQRRSQSADPRMSNSYQMIYQQPGFRTIADELPNDFLAGLERETLMRELAEEDIVEDWILQCQEMDSNWKNCLSRNELHDAFALTIDLARAARQGRLQSSIVDTCLSHLEAAKQYDQENSRSVQYITPRTQHLFRALAYVSHCHQSAALGRVLFYFFTQNLRWIAKNNDKRSMWQWCRAILESNMERGLQRRCFTALQIHRPDVFQYEESQSQDRGVRQVTILLQRLHDLLRGVSDRLDNRRQSPRRSSRSRYTSPRGDWHAGDFPISDRKSPKELQRDASRFRSKALRAERQAEKLLSNRRYRSRARTSDQEMLSSYDNDTEYEGYSQDEDF